MGIDKDIIKKFNPIDEEQINNDYLKTILQTAGVKVKNNRIRNNQDCPCGSGIRYDLCCKGKE